MIVGVDVSSKRIDLAYLDAVTGQPRRWHQELEGKHLIDRVRSIRVEWPFKHPSPLIGGEDTTEIAIEYPFGRSRAGVAALMCVVGAVTRQAPPWARVAWPSSGELRQAIGARNTKDAAHSAITHPYLWEHLGHDGYPMDGWDEHELDALVACLGWTKILEAQDAS